MGSCSEKDIKDYELIFLDGLNKSMFAFIATTIETVVAISSVQLVSFRLLLTT